MFDSNFDTFKVLGLGLALSAMAVPIVVGLLTPGRKGSMRTERIAPIPSWTPEQAMAAYVERLRLEGFKPRTSKGPLHVLAERKCTAPAGIPTSIHTHASKELRAELSVEPAAQGCNVRLVLWMTDPVFADTGEGAFIDGMLDRLLGADLSAPPPKVTNISFHATTALYGGGLSLLAAFLPFTPLAPGRFPIGVAAAIGQELVIILVLSAFALRDVLRRPDEMKGMPRAVIGIALGVVALGIAIATAIFQ